MEPKDVLVAAVQAVEDAAIPQDLRATAFAKAVDLISAATYAVNMPHEGMVEPVKSIASEESITGNAKTRIAERLRIEPDIVGEVFHESDGDIEITVSSAKLDSAKKGATAQLALLIAAARQGAGIEEFTPFDVIRKVAEDYRRYDQANFARTINDMGDVFNYRGTSRNRLVKVSRPGWDAASQLVNALGGGGS